MKKIALLLFLTLMVNMMFSQQRLRAMGIEIGVIPTGTNNAITDVAGVRVGHTTIKKGDTVNTGVTAILPHDGNIFQEKVPAAIYVGNGYGKLSGSTQVKELGNIETPIILTNTLSVATAMNAVNSYTLQLPGNEEVQSVNAVVGETNDGFLNDIRGMHVQAGDVILAIRNADSENVEEGNVGAGTGTVAFGFKGGIGTSSRKLPASLGGYTVGIIVQTNFGGVLQIAGVNVGKELMKFSFSDQLLNNVDGSCMIVVATDAPLDHRNLERLAKRAFLGVAKAGGIVSNGSGDYSIAFSTAAENRIPYKTVSPLQKQQVVPNDRMSPLFMAAIEATEEAILNSLLMSTTTKGRKGIIQSLPMDKVLPILREKGVIKN